MNQENEIVICCCCCHEQRSEDIDQNGWVLFDGDWYCPACMEDGK